MAAGRTRCLRGRPLEAIASPQSTRWRARGALPELLALPLCSRAPPRPAPRAPAAAMPTWSRVGKPRKRGSSRKAKAPAHTRRPKVRLARRRQGGAAGGAARLGRHGVAASAVSVAAAAGVVVAVWRARATGARCLPGGRRQGRAASRPRTQNLAGLRTRRKAPRSRPDDGQHLQARPAAPQGRVGPCSSTHRLALSTPGAGDNRTRAAEQVWRCRMRRVREGAE